jgi:hypothetical protein
MTAVVILPFYLLNQLVPTFADDLCQMARSITPIELWQDMYARYFNWTGRFFVSLLNRLTFSTGEWGLAVFNIINSLVLGASCLYAMKWTLHDSSDKYQPGISLVFSVLTVFLFLLWFTPNVFAEVLLWKTGAIQYFWPCLIVLYVLRPVMVLYLHHTFAPLKGESTLETVPCAITGRSATLLYCVVSFLGGSWLENMAIAIIPIWSGLLVLTAPSRQLWRERIPPVLLLGLGAWCLGTLLLIAAPGNYVRAEAIGDSLNLVQRFLDVAYRCYEIVDKKTLLVYLLFLVIMFIQRPPDSSKRLATSCIFFVLALLPALAMIAAPSTSFVRRVGFPTEFFLIFAAMSLFPVALFTTAAKDLPLVKLRIPALFSLIMFFILLSDSFVVYRNYLRLWQQTRERGEWINVAREVEMPLVPFLPLYFDEDSGLSKLTTATGQINQQHYFARDITTQKDHWTVAVDQPGYGYIKPYKPF